MNKKAISFKVVTMTLGLIVLVIIALIFVPKIVQKTKEGVGFLEEKAGLLTPKGKALDDLQNYVDILLLDNPVTEIDKMVEDKKLDLKWFNAANLDEYKKRSGEDKITGFYNKAESLRKMYYSELKAEEDEESSIKFEIMKEKLFYAKDYAVARYNYYTSLQIPTTSEEGVENSEKLKALKTEMEKIEKKVSKDYEVYAKAVDLANKLKNIDGCEVSEDICETKLKFYCKRGVEREFMWVSDVKCVRDICDTEPEYLCKINQKCYVKLDDLGGFKGCGDCKDVSCNGNNHKTCLEIINKCKKCRIEYKNWMFKACVP